MSSVAGQKQRQALCFVVDSTGSMGSWITALSQTLHEVIDTAVLSGAFDTIGVLAYGDYDGAWKGKPTEWSGWVDVAGGDVLGLHKFTKAMAPKGGGGAPEAYKTALWELLELAPADTRVHALLLTDAPMHLGGSLDSEGKKEKAALGARFPHGAVARALLGHGDIKVSALCSCASSINTYAALAQATGGEVQHLGDTGAAAVRRALQSTLSAWMGAGDAPLPTLYVDGVPIEAMPRETSALLATALATAGGAGATTHHQDPQQPFAGLLPRAISALLAAVATAPDDKALAAAPELQPWAALLSRDDAKLPSKRRAAGPNDANASASGVVAARAELAGPLQAAVQRVKQDDAFVDRLCATLGRVCAESPMALCGNAVLGRLWRAFCARRQDPRRDEFLQLLDKAKAGLAAADLARFNEWNTASHDASAEIRADLREFAATHGVRGLVRYTGGSDGFVPQSLNEVFLSLKRDGVEQVAQFLARLSIDADYVLPPTAATTKDDAAAAAEKDTEGEDGDTNDEEAPLPWGDEAALPLNLPDATLFGLLLHAAVPGMKLSRRPAAILAGLAWRHGSVLKDRAAAHLDAVRGAWVTWARRDDAASTPVVPENFGAAFLYLAAHTAPMLSDAERAQVQFMLRVAAALRAERVELRGVFVDEASSDACLPDHVAACAVCRVARPLSLLAADDGACGYCKRQRTVEARVAGGFAAQPAKDRASAEPALVDAAEHLGGRSVEFNPAPAPGAADATSQFQARCHECRGYFARDRAAGQRGYAKCHYCQRGLQPATVACGKCALLIVAPSGALPGGVCGPCAAGAAPRRLATSDKPVAARVAFPLKDVWQRLYAAVGLEADRAVSASLPAAVLLFRDAVPAKETAAADADAVVAAAAAAVDAAATTADTPAVAADASLATLANGADLWAQLVAAVGSGTLGERPFCALCCEQLAPSKVMAACGRRACEQRICGPCGAAWYGRNKLGAALVPRALQCPCCARDPAAKVLRRWNPDAHATKLPAAVAALPADVARSHHVGWCRTCTRPRDAGPRVCGAEAAPHPAETAGGAWRCDDCATAAALIKASGRALPKCPTCAAPTLRDGGCAHITCPCGAHWCYLCGTAHDAADIYTHIGEAHADAGYGDDEEEDAAADIYVE